MVTANRAMMAPTSARHLMPQTATKVAMAPFWGRLSSMSAPITATPCIRPEALASASSLSRRPCQLSASRISLGRRAGAVAAAPGEAVRQQGSVPGTCRGFEKRSTRSH